MVGDLAKAINSDVVTLSIDAGEIILLYDLEFGKEAPRNRRATRAGKLDTYGPPLIDFTASATVDKATFDIIEAASTQDDRKAYPVVACIITGKNLGSAAPDDIVVAFNAEIPTYKILAPGNGTDTTIRFHTIIDNESYP